MYDAWIRTHVPEDPTGMCSDVTKQMIIEFPELRRVRGHVRWPGETRPWPHWWCIAPDGCIVDPTAAQFPPQMIYMAHDEREPEPTGKCPECGDYTYHSNTFCSDDHYRAYMASLGVRL